MPLDALFGIATVVAILGVTCAAVAARLPLAGTDRATREAIGRRWGAVLVVTAVLLVIAAVLGADPDGPRLAALTLLAGAALSLVAYTVRRTARDLRDARRFAARRPASTSRAS